MKKTAAFLTALVLALVVAVLVHSFAGYTVEKENSGLGTWTSEAKYASAAVMEKGMKENTLLVMGSSELQHQKKTPYHPSKLLAGQGFDLMLVGAGYYQSLYHATLMAALDQGMENRKAVLILAPQWFRKSGVKPEAYASRFSEENYLDMLENPGISKELKAYITDRTKELLEVDPTARERICYYEKRYLEGEENGFEDLKSDLYQSFLREKNRTNIGLRLWWEQLYGKLFGGKKQESAEDSVKTAGPLDFEAARAGAAVDGEKAWGGNPFYVSKRYYENYITKVMDEVKDEGIKTGYSVSPEFEDFECFLKVCREMEITPLIVIAPVNGYWYDYIAFNKEAREDYYRQIRDLCEEYKVRTADFSDREYEKFFMEDTVHIGWKGWVDVCEAIYDYARE